MVYTLTQDLITEPQEVAEGVCLADWQDLEAFDVDQPEQAAQLILPKIVEARAAGFVRTLVAIEKPGYSPNAGGFGQLVPSPCRLVVWHWWGLPVGQSFEGVRDWLRDPRSYVSATLVVTWQRVAQLLDWRTPSWANGNTYANANSITIEADPNNIVGTMETGAELLAQLVRDGVLHPDFELTGHKDWYNTACPGAYYDWLGTIRQRVRDLLAGTAPASTNPEEDELMAIDMDDFAARLRDSMVIEVPGYDKMTIGEAVRYLIQQTDKMPQHLMLRMVRRQGLPEGHPLAGKDTNLESVVAWFDAAIYALAAAQKALATGDAPLAKEIVDELLARIGQLAPKEG